MKNPLLLPLAKLHLPPLLPLSPKPLPPPPLLPPLLLLPRSFSCRAALAAAMRLMYWLLLCCAKMRLDTSAGTPLLSPSSIALVSFAKRLDPNAKVARVCVNVRVQRARACA